MEHTKLLVILNNPLSFSPGHSIKMDDTGRTPVGLVFKSNGTRGPKHHEKIATGIVEAYNATYGNGINPEAVPELVRTLKNMCDYFDWLIKDPNFLAYTEAKAAIEKAKL